jgi:hypothetical protein
MPFQGFRRYTFSRHSILQNAPAQQSGVYGISNAQEWLLVGSTEDLQAALLEHLNMRGSTLLSKAPSGFIFEVCPPGGSVARQRRLVAELHPSCNLPGV